MAVATEAEAEKQDGDNRTMGRKHTVPYGLYRAHGFVSAFLAKQTGFSEDDLGSGRRCSGRRWSWADVRARPFRRARRDGTRGLSYVFKHDEHGPTGQCAGPCAVRSPSRLAINRFANSPRSRADSAMAWASTSFKVVAMKDLRYGVNTGPS
jgi:hypothetical protein